MPLMYARVQVDVDEYYDDSDQDREDDMHFKVSLQCRNS